MRMHRIVESVEIDVPVEEVFNFLQDVEARMRLSPSYEVLKVEQIKGDRMKKGAKFRIELMSDGKKVEYISEVVKFKRNKVIATRGAEGRIRLTLKVKETPTGGTLLIHDEEFVIPKELVAPDHEKSWWEEEKGEEAKSMAHDIYIGIKELAKLIFGDPEEMRRTEELKNRLREHLRVWLRRIKDRLEKEHGMRTAEQG